MRAAADADTSQEGYISRLGGFLSSVESLGTSGGAVMNTSATGVHRDVAHAAVPIQCVEPAQRACLSVDDPTTSSGDYGICYE